MTLSSDDLSNLVEKYQPITRYTIGENERHIMFHLERNKEISVLINQNDEDFEGLGQLNEMWTNVYDMCIFYMCMNGHIKA